MKNSNEKKMMENGTDIARPVQKQLEENMSHQIVGYFYAELDWKCIVVVIKDDQGLP